ncbi:sigma factor, partial [Streptomyces sp. NPDC059455]|uniref:sigma factor n=1 Tax=Streptomyces sp. NPDC059455 TaxID=3346837 RepID=UPI0036B1C53F
MTQAPFVAHRGLLFTVAYEMLGSAADAEDVVQESWLRWADVDPMSPRMSNSRRACRSPRMRVSRSEQQAVVERFLVALRTGRLRELLEVMAPDVVMITDGGGVVAAALVPIHGAEEVAKVLARANQVVAALETTPVWLNGAPAGPGARERQTAPGGHRVGNTG